MTGEYHRRRGARRRSSPPAIPTACTRVRPARAKCRPTASRWRGAPARRSSTWKCSGGTPTTSPIRRRGSACRSIRIRCSARRSRRAWSTRPARNSSTSSRTIRSPSGPTRCSSRRWPSRSMPARRATTAAIIAGFDHCDAGGSRTLHDLRQEPIASSACDFPEQLVETAVTSHYRQGGIDVDTATMRSSVPGLYVAGGVGGHSNGLIGLATYDGKVVADGVARICRHSSPDLWSKQESRRRAGGSTICAIHRGDGSAPDQR